ncbi:MAG: ABC transporter ATP-binding protein [Pseudomonadota bacterium]
MIEAKAVCKRHQLDEQQISALRPTSLTAVGGELLTIVGPSGSGKSTLLSILGGLDEASSGHAWYDGIEMSQLDAVQRARLRNRSFGFVFQTPHVLGYKTVKENVALPLNYVTSNDMSNGAARVNSLLNYVGLADKADRYPNTLSGGELQRVVFARALLMEPSVIFADEPTGALDAGNSILILDLLRDQTRNGKLVIMATHDATAMSYGTRSIELDKYESD